MNKPRKAFVSIYCKIYTENFSNKMIEQQATGKEIHDFLLADSGNCFDDHDQLIPGDCNIWYLGSSEKFGSLVYRDKVWNWGFGESSFDTVAEFVEYIYKDGLFTEAQYQNLMAKIEEGRQISDMYAIGDYLYQKIHPQQGKETNYAV